MDSHDVCRQTFNIIRVLVGNTIVNHLEEIGTSSVGAAPTSSTFLT